jgi:UDP-N-acetylglucosamine--N-acetylmuramyl-(pentapeptide) pyrophosphoryl-undecaprenol N-acetylglucosamine transferase
MIKKNIALTGGSTWGHVFPLLAIKKHLDDSKKYNFLWFGEDDSLEEEIAKKNNIEFHRIASGKIRRYFDWKNFYEPLKNITGVFEWLFYVLKYKIDFVISKWGFVSVPLCIAAKILGKKVYVHESDQVMWLANTVISKIATKVFYTFPNDKIDGKKHILSGPVMNEDLLKTIKNMSITENITLEILVIAGSQWSRKIFKSLLGIMNNLLDINFTVILWEKNLEFRQEFEKFNNVKIIDFASQEQLWEIYRKTDIAISRGSSSLWELFYFGIHTIIIPLKATGGDHQTKNGEYFKEKYGSNLLDEDTNLGLELFRLIQKYKDMRKDSLNLKWFIDWAEKIESEL